MYEKKKKRKMYRNGNNKVKCITQEEKKQSVYTHSDKVSATVLCNSILSLCIYARRRNKNATIGKLALKEKTNLNNLLTSILY